MAEREREVKLKYLWLIFFTVLFILEGLSLLAVVVIVMLGGGLMTLE